SLVSTIRRGHCESSSYPLVKPDTNSSSRLAHVGHRAARDKTHSCKHPETSWPCLRYRTSSSCLQVVLAHDRRILFRAAGKKLKHRYRPAAYLLPIGSCFECRASSHRDIQIARSSKPESLHSADSREPWPLGRLVFPYPLHQEFSVIL